MVGFCSLPKSVTLQTILHRAEFYLRLSAFSILFLSFTAFFILLSALASIVISTIPI
jgi:hypothetical protein